MEEPEIAAQTRKVDVSRSNLEEKPARSKASTSRSWPKRLIAPMGSEQQLALLYRAIAPTLNPAR